MSNGEFYSSSEYNSIAEYQSIPAEIYHKSKEVNPSGKEQGQLGNEITNIEKKRKPKKAPNNSKGIVDKIMGSVKSVATTVTVATAAVVVTTTLVATSPNIELNYLNTGDDFVEYSFSINEMEPDKQYSIVVSTSNEEDREQELEQNEDGEYLGGFDDLRPAWEYTLSVIEKNTDFGTKTLFERKFQTTKDSVPKHYEGVFKPPSIDEIKIGWDVDEQSNKILLEVKEFESYGQKYRYEIIGKDEMGLTCVSLASNTATALEAIIDKDISLCNLSFNIYARDTLLHTESIGTLNLAPMSVEIKEYELCDFGEIRLHFTVNNPQQSSIENAVLRVEYQNGSEQAIDLSQKDLENGYIDIEVSEAQKIKAELSLTEVNEKYIASRQIATQGEEFTITNDLEASAIVFDEYSTLELTLKTAIVNATYVKITSKDGSEQVEEFYTPKLQISIDTSEEQIYTLVLLNDANEAISTECVLSIPAIPAREDYIFNYKNTGDVGITYNEDGTINIYVHTGFETIDNDMYYQITLFKDSETIGRYISRDPYVEILNLENTTYGIRYDVCKDIGDVQYSYRSVTPSGLIGESNIAYRVSAEIEPTQIALTLDYLNTTYDLDSVVIYNKTTGEEIKLSKSDFQDDTEAYNYKAIITTTLGYDDELEIRLLANEYGTGLDDIPSYQGSAYKEFILTY